MRKVNVKCRDSSYLQQGENIFLLQKPHQYCQQPDKKHTKMKCFWVFFHGFSCEMSYFSEFIVNWMQMDKAWSTASKMFSRFQDFEFFLLLKTSWVPLTDAHSEPFQTSKMEHFLKFHKTLYRWCLTSLCILLWLTFFYQYKMNWHGFLLRNSKIPANMRRRFAVHKTSIRCRWCRKDSL